MNNKALEYCKLSINEKTTPKYVKLQMKDFINTCEGKDKKYKISEKKLKQVNNILKILVMPKGLKAGQTLYECTAGYQWLFYIAILCTVYRENENKRRYEIGLLEICRKNFKTFTIATIFILLFLTEPKFSKFFSVAPDGALSREVREAISEIIRSSPLIYEYKDNKRTENITGYRYTVAMPEKALEKINIKIDGRQLVEKPNGYAEVTFTGLELSLYMMNNQPQVKATATGISLVNNKA